MRHLFGWAIVTAAAACGPPAPSPADHSAPADRAPAQHDGDGTAGAAAPLNSAAASEPDVTRLRPTVDPQTVLLSIYAVDDELLDPFATAPQPPPDGVQIMVNSRSGQRVAHVNRLPAEPHATTVARARQWLSTIRLAHGREFVVGILTGVEHNEDVDIVLVEPDPIDVRAAHVSAVVREADEPWIRIELTPAGRRHLAEMTPQWVDRSVAFVAADRLLWAPKLGGAMGDGESDTVGIVRDEAVAAKVRAVLTGDAAALEAVENDRITDGGSYSDVEAIREAAKVPAPQRQADGTTRFFVALSFDRKTRMRLRAELPGEGRFKTSDDGIFWHSGGPYAQMKMIAIDMGCTGTCPDAAGDIEDELVDNAQPGKPFDAAGKTYRQVHTTIADEPGPPRLWARTVAYPDGTPPGLIFDRVEAWCYVRFDDVVPFVRVKVSGPESARREVLAEAKKVCTTLRRDD